MQRDAPLGSSAGVFALGVDRAFRRFRRTGDPRALASVYDRTAPELLGLARHLASVEASAEDLLQATFVTAIEAAATFDPQHRVVPWLVGPVVPRFLAGRDSFRRAFLGVGRLPTVSRAARKAPASTVPSRPAMSVFARSAKTLGCGPIAGCDGILTNHARAARRRARRAVVAGPPRPGDVVDPGAEVEAREWTRALAVAIDRIAEPYRPVLRLHLVHGLDPAEIARVLERPDGTVRAQLHRGLDRLRRALPVGLSAGAATVRVVDAEWETFPRLRTRLGDDLLAGRVDDASTLFRDERLNPADRYLAPDLRRTLIPFVVATAPVLRAAEERMREVGQHEHTAAIAQGKSRFRSFVEIDAAKTPDRRRRDAEVRALAGAAPDAPVWSPH